MNSYTSALRAGASRRAILAGMAVSAAGILAAVGAPAGVAPGPAAASPPQPARLVSFFHNLKPVSALVIPSVGSGGGDTVADPAALGSAIVRIASSQVGATNPAAYGGAGGEWCAAFASWVYRSAGLAISPLTAAYQVGTWAQSGGGELVPPGATPRVGDAVLFEPNGSGKAWPGPGLDISNIAHVNIVATVNPDGSFTTIGGNEHGAVRRQGPYSAAQAPTWWGQTVYGFVRPA